MNNKRKSYISSCEISSIESANLGGYLALYSAIRVPDLIDGVVACGQVVTAAGNK